MTVYFLSSGYLPGPRQGAAPTALCLQARRLDGGVTPGPRWLPFSSGPCIFFFSPVARCIHYTSATAAAAKPEAAVVEWTPLAFCLPPFPYFMPQNKGLMLELKPHLATQGKEPSLGHDFHALSGRKASHQPWTLCPWTYCFLHVKS